MKPIENCKKKDLLKKKKRERKQNLLNKCRKNFKKKRIEKTLLTKGENKKKNY